MVESVPYVTIDLTKAPSRNGDFKILLRCEEADRDVVNEAADKIGMTTAQFLRLVVVQASQRILSGDIGKLPDKMNSDGRLSIVKRAKFDPNLPPGVKKGEV